jgi:hypothetical protein
VKNFLDGFASPSYTNVVRQRGLVREIFPSEFPGNCILPVTSGESLLLANHNILNADNPGVKIVV